MLKPEKPYDFKKELKQMTLSVLYAKDQIAKIILLLEIEIVFSL